MIRQIEDVKRIGKKQESLQIEGELHDIYLYDVNIPEESAVVYLSRETLLPKLWISIIRTKPDSAEGLRMILRDLEANVDIPDNLFDVPMDIEFSVQNSGDLPAESMQRVGSQSGLVVVTTSDTQLRDNESVLGKLQPGDIVGSKEKKDGATLIEAPQGPASGIQYQHSARGL